MTAPHNCPGDCGKQVPQHKFACPDCWRRLPSALRDAIWHSRGRNLRGHMVAMAAAHRWYAEQNGGCV